MLTQLPFSPSSERFQAPSIREVLEANYFPRRSPPQTRGWITGSGVRGGAPKDTQPSKPRWTPGAPKGESMMLGCRYNNAKLKTPLPDLRLCLRSRTPPWTRELTSVLQSRSKLQRYLKTRDKHLEEAGSVN